MGGVPRRLKKFMRGKQAAAHPYSEGPHFWKNPSAGIGNRVLGRSTWASKRESPGSSPGFRVDAEGGASMLYCLILTTLPLLGRITVHILWTPKRKSPKGQK